MQQHRIFVSQLFKTFFGLCPRRLRVLHDAVISHHFLLKKVFQRCFALPKDLNSRLKLKVLYTVGKNLKKKKYVKVKDQNLKFSHQKQN